MLSIDEAIAHARDVAKRNREQWKNCPADRRDIEHQTCEQCAEEHEQLAEWLGELRELRVTVSELQCEMQATGALLNERDKETRNKAIDDFVTNVKEHQYLLSDVINSKDYGIFTVGIEQIAEQLKAGGENE